MILPFFSGILSFKKAPVTWAIFFLNLAVAFSTLQAYEVGQKAISEILDQDLFLQKQGEFYSQFIESKKEMYTEPTLSLAHLAHTNGKKEKLELLGGLAIRDNLFLDQVDSFGFTGDVVALDWWKDKLHQIRKAQEDHPSYSLGLESSNTSLVKWVTYQFVHSGALHFLGNMFFLLIFGSALEPALGGLGLLVLYLLTGMMAAGSFLLLSGLTSIPLIGASGAVSGIMAYACVLFWNRPVRYIYFLFVPQKGFSGYVYLPAWVAAVLWMFSDLAGFLGTLNEFGGVAHAAHLGGEAAGILVALSILFFRAKISKQSPSDSNYPVSFPSGSRT